MVRFTLLFILIALACCEPQWKTFKKECPQDFKYGGGHYLHIPIQITPNKEVYSIGDTVSIASVFSDSIYDLSTDDTYLIKDFPFNPFVLLYRFTNDTTWDAGFRHVEVIVDNLNRCTYHSFGLFADNITGYTHYEEGMYSFEIKIVLEEKGRYVSLMSDVYMDNIRSGNSKYNAKADSITFEGKCSLSDYSLCWIIEGDSHVNAFEKEILYLDKNVYSDNLRDFSTDNSTGTYGKGSVAIEWTGYFGFEVK